MTRITRLALLALAGAGLVAVAAPAQANPICVTETCVYVSSTPLPSLCRTPLWICIET